MTLCAISHWQNSTCYCTSAIKPKGTLQCYHFAQSSVLNNDEPYAINHTHVSIMRCYMLYKYQGAGCEIWEEYMEWGMHTQTHWVRNAMVRPWASINANWQRQVAWNWDGESGERKICNTCAQVFVLKEHLNLIKTAIICTRPDWRNISSNHCYAFNLDDILVL